MYGWVLAILAPLSASAGTIESYYYDQFGYGSIANKGWTTGYSGDPWYSDGGQVYSSSDANVGDSAEALHNYAVRGDFIEQGAVRARFRNDDDDTIGVVMNCHGRYYYIVGHTEDSAPPPLTAVNTPTIFLIKVEDSTPTLLESVSTTSLDPSHWNDFYVYIDNGVITVVFNGIDVLSYTDSSPLAAGQYGIYAYDSGFAEWDADTNAYFDDVGAYFVDEDNDQVADDLDNCESIYNPDQTDRNENGIGDECDSDSDTDTDTDSDSDTDTDTDSDGDLDTGTPNDTSENVGGVGGGGGAEEGITFAGQCACQSPGGWMGVPWMIGGLSALLGLRRRRRIPPSPSRQSPETSV